MRTLTIAVASLGVSLSALAQTPPAPPPAPPQPSTPTSTGAAPPAGRSGPTYPTAPKMEAPAFTSDRALQELNSIRSACSLVENDGKLFAACDNSTPAARNRSGPSYVPQLSTEWELFARRLVEADWVANGKRRPVVVLNNGEVIAESTAGGVVKLKK